ncbi:MAG TPA: patatin-like phospholipase family protein [Acidimicrobiales bacterium]
MSPDDVPAVSDGLAWPRTSDARYGDGLRLGVSLGGGGVFFVAWQLSYLHEMAERGINLDGADRVVGTSAGALVAAALTGHRVTLLNHELNVLAKAPRFIAALAPSGNLRPSQIWALELFRRCADDDPDAIRGIGHASLAAQTPAPSLMARNISLILATRTWPSPKLHVTCTDTYSGERCVITKATNVGISRAVAASSAVPGLFAPQQIGDRRCMDGAVSGSGTHLDLLAGSERVVVLALTDGTGLVEGMMTTAPGATEAEHAALEASGTRVFRQVPASVDPMALMDPATVPDAIETGRRQAAADANELRSFLS